MNVREYFLCSNFWEEKCYINDTHSILQGQNKARKKIKLSYSPPKGPQYVYVIHTQTE